MYVKPNDMLDNRRITNPIDIKEMATVSIATSDVALSFSNQDVLGDDDCIIIVLFIVSDKCVNTKVEVNHTEQHISSYNL